jgi:heme exporter protein D
MAGAPSTLFLMFFSLLTFSMGLLGFYIWFTFGFPFFIGFMALIITVTFKICEHFTNAEDGSGR